MLVYLSKGLKHIEAWAMGWLALMLLSKYAGFSWYPWGEFKTIFSGLLQYGNLFVAGILFYGLKTKGNKWYRHVAIGLCFVVQCLIWKEAVRQQEISFALFIFIFYLFVYGRLSFIINKPLVFLGTISYSLYLIHQNIGYIIIQWFYFFGHNRWLMFFVPLVCSLLIATLMTYTIEKPLMKLIRFTYKILKQKILQLSSPRSSVK